MKLAAGETIALVAIVAVAAILRFWSIGFGLPHTWARPDEDAIVAIALRIYERGPNPHWFTYPTLYMYLVAFAYEGYSAALALRGHAMSAAAFVARIDTNPWPFYLIPRYLTATMGTLSVPVLFMAARRLFDTRTALIAAALLATAFLHVRDSHFGVADIPATFMTVVAFWGIVSSDLDRRRLSRVLAVGALCGLAASTKYNAAIVALPFFIRIAQRARETRAPLRDILTTCLVAGAGLGLGFVAGTPFSLVEPQSILRDISGIGAHLAGGHGIDLGRGWTAHIRISLRYGLGVPVLAAALAGIVWLALARPSVAAVALSFPLTYYLVSGAGKTVFVRYMDPILPFACLLAAFTLASIARAIGRTLPRSEATAAALLTLLAAWPNAGRSIAFDRLIGREDSRNLVATWMEATFPPQTTVGQAGGSSYGEVQFRRSAGFVPQVYNFDTEGFQLYGRNVADLPQVIVLQHVPLRPYRWLPDAIARLLRGHYRSIKTFEVENGAPGPPPVYDQQDAYFVPLDGFEHLNRPGPAFEVFERVTP